MSANKSSNPSIPAIPEGNTQSSLSQILEKLRKEEAAAESARTRCKVCFKEIAPKRLCGGHGGGGGSDSDSEASEEKADATDDASLMSKLGQTVKKDLDDLVNFIETEMELEADLISQSDDQRFNPDIIAALLESELLIINNDREALTLTIQLQCEPALLSQEQRDELTKYIALILQELEVFKEQNHILENCVEISRDEQGNVHSLSINLPTLALYDKFIEQLANNLLPKPRVESQAQEGIKQTQSISPNPYSTIPRPSKQDKNRKQEDKLEKKETSPSSDTPDKKEEQVIFNPSPLSRIVKPR